MKQIILHPRSGFKQYMYHVESFFLRFNNFDENTWLCFLHTTTGYYMFAQNGPTFCFVLFVCFFVYVLACLFVCFVLFFAMKERIDVLSKSCGYHHSKHSFFIMPNDWNWDIESFINSGVDKASQVGVSPTRKVKI